MDRARFISSLRALRLALFGIWCLHAALTAAQRCKEGAERAIALSWLLGLDATPDREAACQTALATGP
jgi:hypothetical protein